jgi:adenylate cyclase
VPHPRRPNAADFEAAGLYDPASPRAAGRLALLEWLAEQGATLEQMQQAPSLTGLAGDLHLSGGEHLNVAEVAARVGTTPEQILRVSRAAGVPPAIDDARPYTDKDVVSFTAFLGGVAMFGEEPILQFARVMGSSLARIAEAAVALFLSATERPLLESGEGELALAKANLEAMRTADILPAGLAAVFSGQMSTAIRRFRAAREPSTADLVRITIGFVDMVGFTPLSQQLSPHEVAALVERFEALAHEVTTDYDGRVVKLIGDAVMFVTREAAAACEVALTLVERFADDPAITPRGGLATGPVLIRGGDYYGPSVNLAARLADLAVPREMLVTAEVAAAVSGARLRCEPAGRRALKGFADPVPLFTVERA